MKPKKSLAALAAAAMIAGLSACSGNSEEAESKTSVITTTLQEETTTVSDTTVSDTTVFDTTVSEAETTKANSTSTEENYVVDIISVDYKEYINADALLNLVIKRSDVTPSESYLKYQVNSTAMVYLGTKDVTRTVEPGDTITLDYAGYLDGVAFEGGTASGASLGIGSGSFIPGFEDGLIGAEIGKELSLNLRFPDQYSGSAELAGKEVVFVVTVTGITTLDDSLSDTEVKEATGYDTLEEYLNYLKEETLKSYQGDAIWELLAGSVELIKSHEGLENEYIQLNLSMIDSYASMYGMERADFLELAYGYESEEEFIAELQAYSKNYTTQKLMVIALADQNGLSCSDEEYQEELQDMADYYETTVEEIAGEYSRSEIVFNVLYGKVLDYIDTISIVED